MSGNAPVKKFRIGYVTATIWKNEANDRQFYTVDVARTYKEGDELKNTSSLGHADIMNAVKVLERSEHWIAQQ